VNNDTNLIPAKNKYDLNFKLEVLKEYKYTSISQKNLSKKYNICLASLQRWCYKFKVTKLVKPKVEEPKFKLIYNFENNICEKYKNNEKINSLMSYYNTSRHLILKLLKKNNIEIRNNNIEQRKYTFDYDYFSKIDTCEKAYWLGFLFADGCINSFNDKTSLCLQQRDKEHIIKFCNTIQRSSDDMYFSKKTKSYNLTLCSKKMAKDLINLGCVNKKSLILQFPDETIISKSFVFSFIRGYFDGDGCIHLLNKGLNAVISFVGTNIFLQKLKLILEEHGIICNVYKTHSQAYQLSFSSKQSVEIFYNLIYPNKNVVNLNRKHEKFLNYFEIKNKNLLKNFKKSKHKWFDKRRNIWYVDFTKNKKRIRFGPFKTEKEADSTKLNYEEQNKIGCWN